MKDIKKTLLSVILLIAAFFLFFSGIDNIRRGKNISALTVVIAEEDIMLYKELLLLVPSRLDYFEDNLEKLASTKGIGLRDLKISYSKEKVNIQTDKVGEFKDIAININGDIFEQIYTLKMLHNNFNNFLLFNSINGDKNRITIQARIYGKK